MAYTKKFWSNVKNPKNKYNAKKTVFGGRKYDSKFEAKVAADLEWRKKAGELKEIIPQFKIPLAVNGHHIANYYMDFKVIHKDGQVEFIEVKGFETPVWRMKWRILEAIKDEIEPGVELTLIK